MVKIAFYKAKGNWIDAIVRFRTNSIYSHCELVIGDSWYTSSHEDGGVRCKKMDDPKGNWDFIDIEIPIQQAFNVYCKARGKKYDYIGALIGRFIRADIQSPNRYFCSELVAEMIGIKNPYRHTPESLYRLYNTKKRHSI